MPPCVFSPPSLLPLLQPPPSHPIPSILETTTTFLSLSLLTPGLFRISASCTALQKLQKKYDKKGPKYKHRFKSGTDEHLAAGILKMWIRSGQICTTEEVWGMFSAANGINVPEARLDRIQDIIEMLPSIQLNILLYLTTFLLKVVEHASTNKMTVQNISTVFAPNIFRTDDDPTMIMQDTRSANQLLVTILENHARMFQNCRMTPLVELYASAARSSLPTPIDSKTNSDVDDDASTEKSNSRTPSPPPRAQSLDLQKHSKLHAFAEQQKHVLKTMADSFHKLNGKMRHRRSHEEHSTTASKDIHSTAHEPHTKLHGPRTDPFMHSESDSIGHDLDDVLAVSNCSISDKTDQLGKERREVLRSKKTIRRPPPPPPLHSPLPTSQLQIPPSPTSIEQDYRRDTPSVLVTGPYIPPIDPPIPLIRHDLHAPSAPVRTSKGRTVQLATSTLPISKPMIAPKPHLEPGVE